jgi:hypothetical protein
MRPTARRYALVTGLCASLSLAACNNDDDELTGVFTGTAMLSAQGTTQTFPLRLTLSQSGSSLSGSFEATEPGGTTSRGTVSGTVSSSSVSMSFTPTTPGDCPAQLSGTHSGSRLSGTLHVDCPGQPSVPGTFELLKQ